jgi:membrane protease YdiL (CAAX protease family)
MSSENGKSRKDLSIVLTVYVLLCAFLALGNHLFVRFPEDEALGGNTLGLTSLVLGIIVPFHLRRTGVISFRFLPLPEHVGKAVVGTALFAAFYLLLFPSGVLWQRTTMAFFANPPSAMAALSTFLSLLWATAAYGFVFWGGMLHELKRAYGSVVAVLVTSVLFSLYHLSQFAFCTPTPAFLLMIGVSALMLASFTLYVGSVLPTLIVHQLAQFVGFAVLGDNPFADDLDRSVYSLVMLLVLFGIYEGLFRLIRRAGRERGSLPRQEQGVADA